MERYGDYKDSGIEWIGGVPSHWELVRISSLYDQRSEKASADDYAPLSVTMQGVVPQLDTAAKSQDTDNRKLVRSGDFVINSRSDRRGSCGIAYQDGTVSLISNVLTPKKPNSFSSEYYGMLFKTEGFADEYYRWGTGIVDDLWSTNWSRMKNILVLSPPEVEQKAIADYLSARTSEIDALIEETEKSIDLLEEYRKSVISEAVTKGLDPDVPMKDSGVEWIGLIPSHWDAKKLRYLGRTQNGISKSAEFFGYGLPFVSYGNVYRNELSNHQRFGLIDSSEKEREVYSVQRGDVLFTRTSETIDEVGIAATCLETIPDSCFAGFLIRWRPDNLDRLDPAFLAHYFRSEIYRPYLTKEMNLVTRASLSQQLLGGMYVLVPPINEQRDIADYLDEKCTAIEELKSKQESLIEALEEYRKSLIAEAATGKFKVPGVM